MIQELKKMSKTIEDFRNFLKPNRNFELTILNHLVKRALGYFEQKLHIESIKVETDIPENIELFCLKNLLEQVIINIIKNAIDEFSEKKIDNATIKIGAKSDEFYTIISVSDNAGGIEADVIKKIFDPYFSTKSEQGTGLGLYMSKLIIEDQLEGKIEVENRGEGARFIITIPHREVS